ncbi:F-box/kelch-repeat protein At1g55270-like [Zingiber officinale]|uniref:F-box/kelch-repeat protein At1g55270-like n=1 Tax=Zingiber officinale TaxID=94328 RepID=UPI001C4BBA6D|nr:F-box/kelch-repeat protein At1g55270-like [Zingiber officinale]
MEHTQHTHTQRDRKGFETMSGDGEARLRRNPPPPPLVVDTSACLCRADAGFRTARGAKKYVPTTNLCVQPSIRNSIHPVRSAAATRLTELRERSRRQSALLPGLPDDLAVACLVRVPRADHRKLRLVCRRWQRLLSGNYYYSLRRTLGLAEEWLYVIKRDGRDGRISWEAFDPVHQLWRPLPPIPKDYSQAVGFGCAALSGCHLYLFGGRDPRKGSMRRVIYYNARTNKWHRAPDLLRRRQFFGSCVIDNRLYVAGGESEGVSRSLRSAEMYDPSKNRWSFIAELSSPMVPLVGVIYQGKWFLKGLGPQQQVLSEVYAPESDAWESVFDGMVSGWRNPSVCIDGELFGLDCKDGCRLRVYEAATDSWRRGTDSKAHLGSSRAVEAAALVPLMGKLCIVRNNMSITLVDVVRDGGGNGSEEERWETIAGKGQIKTFVTNLLSTIAGRSGGKTHIVHCQVLHA